MKDPFLAFYDDFLDIKLINEIEVYVEKARFEPVWKTSYSWWDNIKRETSPIPILELPSKFNKSIREQLKKTSLTWEDDKIPQKSQYYLYPPGGYVGWHNDGTYDFASMIFLNPIWNMEWGGIFLYEDLNNLGIRGEIPVFNRCIINGGGVPHAVSRLTPDAPPRRVIVTFGSKISQEDEPEKNVKWGEWRKNRNVDYRHVNDPSLRNLAIAAEQFCLEKK